MLGPTAGSASIWKYKRELFHINYQNGNTGFLKKYILFLQYLVDAVFLKLKFDKLAYYHITLKALVHI